MLNVTQFNSSIQSMVAQMAYAQRASSGLDSSLKSIATITFASIVAGIGGITAAIAISTKAAAEWETQMLGLARVAIPEFDYTMPEGKKAFTEFSRAFQDMYIEIPVKSRPDLTKAAEPYALAGYEGEALYNLTEQTLKMVKATNYEVTPDDIANMVIKSSQINREQSGIDIQDPILKTQKMTKYSSDIMDKVLTVANKYTIGAKDLTDAIVYASGSAVLRGTANDIDSQIAFYALMNQYGIRPDLMRTALTSSVSTAGLAGESTARIENALSKIGMQTRDAEGKKIAEFSRADVASKLLGVTKSQYEKMAEENMGETQIRLLDAIESLDVDRLTKNALGTGLFGSYAGREFSKLGAGGALETFREIQDVSKSSGGEVNRAYTNTIQTLNDQWDLMGQRLFSVKEVFGEIFTGPVLNGVKGFSESLKGAVQWLQQIVDSSRNLDGTVNTWEAVGKVIDGLKSKIPKDLFKYTVSLAGAALVISNLGTIKDAAVKAADVLLKMAGVSLAPIATPILGIVGGLGTVTIAAAAVALGLAAIGYSLAPEKFTYFNQVASEALNGVAIVARQVYDDISRGDWGAAGEHLKTGFTNAIAWIQQINWSQLGGEIVTMIGDGANAVIGTVLDIGGWIYDSLSKWVDGKGAYNLGDSIGTAISDGIKQLIDIDYGGIIKKAFGLIATWATLGWDIGSAVVGGILDGINQKLPDIQNSLVRVFINAMAEISDLVVRTMNTAIILADTAVTKIKDAFSLKDNSVITAATDLYNDIANPLGKLADDKTKYFAETNSYGFTLDDEVDAINNREQYSNDFYTSVSKITDSASKLNTALVENKEAYMANTNTVAKEVNKKKNSSGSNKYTPPAPTSKNVVTGVPTTPSSYSDDESSSMSSWGGIGGIGKGISEISKAISKGYLTGGQGYVKEEMLPGSKEGTYSSITDQGYNALLWKMDLTERQLGLLIDSPKPDVWANAKYQEYLNGDLAIKPIKELESSANKLKTSSDEAAKITTSGATSSVNILKDGIFQSTISFDNTVKETAKYSSEKTISTADFVNASRRNNVLETNAMTKQNVAESYSPVKIGLTASGQEIAVIGKVAQQQFEASGNKWVGDTQKSGFSFFTDATTGGKNVESAGTNAGNSINNGASALDSVAAKLRNLEFMFGGGTVTNKIGDTPGAKYGEVIEGRTLGEYIKELQGSKTLVGTGSNVAPDTLNVDNFEDMTCMGNRVMVNALKYTPPGGETTSYNPMDSVSIRSASNVEGTFTDMTCMGNTITIPGLKYTNPYGTTSYINPSEYIIGGGVMDYQQASAKKAGEITTSAAKSSANVQREAANYTAQTARTINVENFDYNRYRLAQEQNAAIERGDLWINNVAFTSTAWGTGVQDSLYDFSKVRDESVDQALDYLGYQATTHDKIYTDNQKIIEEGNKLIGEITGATNAMGGLASKIESAGNNLGSSLSSALSGFLGGYGGGGRYIMGGFGGTSKGGGGAWVGTLPTPSWSGVAISNYVQSHPSGSNWQGSSFSWGAKGSLIEEPSRIIAGEKGRELLLPNYLTELFLKLAAMGFNNRSNGDGNIITIVNIDGKQIEKIVSKRQKSNLNLRGLKLH